MKRHNSPSAAEDDRAALRRVRAELIHCERLFSEFSEEQMCCYCCHMRLALLAHHCRLTDQLRQDRLKEKEGV